MTSSLVGSEMCIRDSPSSGAPPARPAATVPAPSSGAPPAPPAVTFLAVSYTHLTLPTICSV
eukprot:4416402-Prorocentrum_lima.AAC.1